MIKKIIAILVLITLAFFSLRNQMPQGNYIENPSETQFSNKRAFTHINAIGNTPHGVSSKAHQKTIDYISDALEKMGLDVHIQEGNSSSNWGSFTKAQNIIARIKGTESSKALVLMSHYDSHHHSSPGASDAASGVATILEGIRALISSKEKLKNDLIILITDAEEIGLVGARLFVEKHPWVNDIGLVLNFEARGSGGPSFTLLETNKGNKELISEFKKANPTFPVANSLAYSIYKKLPNDTDLTIFRKNANIQGFNFAFIDDHFDYHTALDTPERLDNNTLSHQASYLMPLLTHFGNTNLTQLNSTENSVYFNTIFGMHSYPYSWIFPLAIMAFICFILLLGYGILSKELRLKSIGKGFIAFFTALTINAAIGFFGWKLLLILYPQYNEILHGFPYNGHLYILFFVLLSLSVLCYIYKKVYHKSNTAELLVAPILFWAIINIAFAEILQGASFFVIPLYFTILAFAIVLFKKTTPIILLTILCIPTICILVPFIPQLPIALGLKIVAASSVLVTVIFGLSLGLFSSIRRKKILGHLMLISAIIVFIVAHFNSQFTAEKPKPNSLVYLQDSNTEQAYWLSYDMMLDDWTNSYFNNTTTTEAPISFGSKYRTNFNKVAAAPVISIPETSMVKALDTCVGINRRVKVILTPQRYLNTIEISSNNKADFTSFAINGTPIKLNEKSRFSAKSSKKIATYYLSKQDSLVLEFTIPKTENPHIELLETSNDLLSYPGLNISKRDANMIPKPFVVNDAVIVKRTLYFNE